MSQSTLTIIAKIVSKEDKTDLVKTELLKLIAPTLKEKGCISYHLHQDNENPNIFLFVEKWENRVLWQEHMNQAHLADYVKATEGAVEEFIINEMTEIA